MTSIIHQLLELGKHYAQNKLWPQAATTFEKALEQLCANDRLGLESFDGSRWHDLKPALQELGQNALELSSCTEDSALKRLHKELAAVCVGADVERAQFMTPFHAAHHHWILVFHDRRDIGFVHHPVWIPDGNPIAFLFDMESCRPERIPTRAAAQISYAHSQLAWAKVNIAIGLYTVGQILIDEGNTAIRTAARGFEHALLLVPNSSWALSHLGETYRAIANGWPPSVKNLTMKDSRVLDYIRSFLYFNEAIRIAPDDFWAHAHFGAAVVNARVFMSVQIRIPIFEQFIHSWFPDMQHGRKPDPNQYQRLLLDKALDSLIKAQRLQGNFYPWAQLYMADVLFLQCVGEAPSVAVQQGLPAMIWTLDGLALQPKLAGSLFEPGEIYNNPFFQISQLYLWNKQNVLAWQYARLGISRAFKFNFVPGVERLLGYQLLATIAQKYLEHPEPNTEAGVQSIDATIGGLAMSSIPIPPKPFDRNDQLTEFIVCIIKECRTVTASFIHRICDTNIQISLLQVCFILVDLRSMLAESPDFTAPRARDEATVLINEILDKCGFCLDTHPRNELGTEPIYLFGLTYSLCARLRAKSAGEPDGGAQ